MATALSAPIRQKIIALRTIEKLSYRKIATQLSVNYHTVRQLCLRYQTDGMNALSTNYSNCGKKISSQTERIYRLVRLIRHFHPQWGVPYILTKIRIKYPHLCLQSSRQYQRRLKVDCPSSVLPPPQLPIQKVQEKVRCAHDEWQIDAKERITTESGLRACYLNITDTKSAAMLKIAPFPPPPYCTG